MHPALGILDRDEFLVLTSWFLRLLLPVAPQKQLLLHGHQKYWVVNEYEDA
jgi:hypothetical protein